VTISNGAAPALDITLSGVPASIPKRDEFTARATVTNTGGSAASGYSVVISFNPSGSMSRQSPSNSSQSLPAVAAGGSQSVSWVVKAENEGPATLTMTLKNSSGQTVDTVSQSITITN
jgi:hypothetical protein